MPLRVLCGPAGCGKSSALVTYLTACPRRTAYVALRDDDALEAVRERLAQALDIGYTPASCAALLAALATKAPCEIAIDDADRATPETIEELLAMVGEAPEDVAFVFVARSRAALDPGPYLARGMAALLDDNGLAFDGDDIARLCETLGVSYVPADISRLLEETEGWPIACSWVLRDAAEARTGLAGAYDRWRLGNGRHFADFLRSEFERAGDEHRSTFRVAEDRERLASLEVRGLFVRYAGGAYRPYRVARQFEIEAIPAASVLAPEPGALLAVRMFGRFETSIAGRRIEWIRRREAQIFKYLLLKPDGVASRTELRELFWPDANSHLADQSIRTASSNIRKAIAAIVGYGNVDRYFTSQGAMAVNLEHTVIDVRRFTAHVADGDTEYERRHTQEALAHYRAAEALYGGELLSGEYPEPWYAPRAEMFRALHTGLLERLAEIYAETGSLRRAQEYAARAAESRPALAAVPGVRGAGA